jgi:PAS domain S-box-containing protein
VPRPLTDLAGLNVTAEDLLAAVLDASAQPIWVVDPDGVIRFANPAAVVALGYDGGDELVGRDSHDTIHHSHPDGTPRPVDECPMLRPRATGESVSIDLDWLLRRDGTMLPVSYVSAPIQMEKGRGVVVAFADLEDRLRAERDERARTETLVVQQESVRRIAALVTGGAASREVFAAIAREVARVLGLQLVEVSRFEPDGTVTVIGAWSDRPQPPEAGARWPLDGPTMPTRVQRTGQPVRLESCAQIPGAMTDAAGARGIVSAAGAPIVVDGELWGVVSAGADHREPVSADAERRLGEFTALVATAISNTQSREDVRRLAEQEAALRRLATLVAEGAESALVFAAVCEETGRLLGATSVNLAHFTADGFNLTMAGWSVRDVHVPTGSRLSLDGDSINTLVRDTAAPGRVDSYDGARGELAAELRRLGIRCEVGAPVMVEGRVWGALIAGTDEDEPLPLGAEHRLARFAQLIATAISNATARSDLVASRARIVEAADEQRRRVVRDLHDGAQQRLVQAVMTLQRLQARNDLSPEARPLVEDGAMLTRSAIDELRELARGIHPAILTHHGLGAAVDGLAERAPLPVDIEISDDRYPTAVESAAYFVVAEALTNVAKYAQASSARVTASRIAGDLVLAVEDDGVGGARPAPGSGLSGLRDRLSALDGTLTVDSQPGAGTRVRAVIPLPASG